MLVLVLADAEKLYAWFAEIMVGFIFGSIAGVMSQIMTSLKGNDQEFAIKLNGTSINPTASLASCPPLLLAYVLPYREMRLQIVPAARRRQPPIPTASSLIIPDLSDV